MDKIKVKYNGIKNIMFTAETFSTKILKQGDEIEIGKAEGEKLLKRELCNNKLWLHVTAPKPTKKEKEIEN